MSLSIQFYSLLTMIGTGIAAGAIIDAVHTAIESTGKTAWLRRKGRWMEGFFWLLIGCGTFIVLLQVRDGAWRMYDPVAQVSGLLLYATLFHRPFRIVGRLLWILIVRPIWWILRLLFSLIQFIGFILFQIGNFLISPFRFVWHSMMTISFKKREK